MNAELYGFAILLRLRQFMKNSPLNPLTDFQLANIDYDDKEISEAFKMPWCRRVITVRETITRQQWQERKSKSNGSHQVDLMK